MNWLDGLDPRWIGTVIRKDHWHFHRRLWDRYSIILGPGEFSTIITAIRTGRAVLVERRGKRAISSIRLASRNERIYVLAVGRTLVTALRPRPRLNELRRAGRREPVSGAPHYT